jgi:hypothetical protein
VLVVAIAVLACCVLALVGGSAAWLIWGPAVRVPSRPTTTARTVQVRTATPSATPLPQSTPTPSPTQTTEPTSTPTPQAPAVPTPVICEGIDALNGLSLVSGQAFRCSVTEEELNAALAAQPELPCQPVSLALVDGEIELTCGIAGFDLRIAMALEVADCRADIRVVGGAPGLTEFLEDQIAQYVELVPYDQVCVERAEVTAGVATVEGYRY